MAEWFVQVDGKQYGPFDSAKLVKLAAAGKLKPTDRVRKGSDGDWKQAGRVRRLFDAETQANYSAPESSSSSKRRSSSAPSKPAGATSQPKQRRPVSQAPPAPEPMFDLAEEFETENPYAAPKAAPVAEAPARRKRAPEPTLLWLLFSFQGRIPRRHYWGVNIATGVVFNIIDTGLTASLGEDSPTAALITLVLIIPQFWISFAVQAKRWHDRGKSAWWLLLNLTLCIGWVWMFIELGCLRGTEGGNQYGHDPT